MSHDQARGFGELLRHHRRAAGLTQEALAERAGLSARAIQELEGGRRQPLLDTLRRLLDALPLSEAARAELTASVLPGAASPHLGDPPPLTPGVASNLPAPMTSFVGREREVAEVARLLAGVRLLTLTGPPGVGKTRLAQEVVPAVRAAFPGGTTFVSLAPLGDPGLVLPTIARVLGVHEVRNRPLIETVRTALRDREALLVLDNCEHLAGTCAQLVEAVLAESAGVRILATSRQPFGLGGEAVWPVPPLDTPPSQTGLSTGELLAFDAVRLFADRAGAALPGFALDQYDAEIAARVCRQVDGLPLAIELAAVWVRVLALTELADRLGRRFELLVEGSQAALPRHRTLRATMDWSHDLLSVKERALLRRLAVFAGGWTLGAAEAVCPGPGPEDRGDGFTEVEVLTLLRGLVDKSLVVVEQDRTASTRRGGDGTYRYRFLETIREYAGEQLEAAGEQAALRDRHLRWYAHLAEQAAPELLGSQQLPWLERLERERDNLRAALAWSARPDGARADVEAGLQLVGALWRFWFMRLRVAEARRVLAGLLARAAEVRDPDGATPEFGVAWARALLTAGSLAYYWDDEATCSQYLHESIELSRRSGYAPGVAYALNWLAWRAMGTDAHAPSRRYLEESVALGRTCRDRYLLYEPLYGLGHTLQAQGDFDRARTCFLESLALGRAAGYRWYCAFPLDDLGREERRRGNFAAARAYVEEALSIWREFDDRFHVSRALRSLGDVCFDAGDLDAARPRYEESLALAGDVGQAYGVGENHIRLALLAVERDDLEAARDHLLEVREALQDASVPHNLDVVAPWLNTAACLAAAERRPARALQLAGAADALRHSARPLVMPNFEAPLRRWLPHAWEGIGDERAAAAWAEGRAMTAEEALAAAREEPSP